ncbi:ABC transporter ATP-binding protein [Sediminitomix flava]|uniref:Iron(III) transport system ATP-binding protein n=1 Tax=Sediminitomix flava TaxID=379075 RepID=A0A315ZYD0_SEDFL|nr:ABC transporter ATP-binding protein [Sediminitomix flava]PWJ42367.1 iron(III) transport system ATP-binding protein [Sediminitomix flava]
MSYLQVSNLQVKAKNSDNIIIKDIDLSMNKGEILAILGASGSGKTTLLKSLSGLLARSKGNILLDGKEVIDPTKKLVAGNSDIALVHQDYALFPNSNIIENLKYPLRRTSKEYQEYRIKELLALCGLEDKKDKLPYQLSGGEKQRVAIACALANEPSLLLFDEPFSNLDPLLKHDFLNAFKEIFSKTNTTVIFVTHHVDEAMILADKIAMIREGEILQVGRPKELYDYPKHSYTAQFFGYTNILSAKESSLINKDGGYYAVRAEEIEYSPIQKEGFEETKLIRTDYLGLYSIHHLLKADIKLSVIDLKNEIEMKQEKIYVRIPEQNLKEVSID